MKFDIIKVTAEIHADGDVYILVGKEYKRIGKLGESDFGTVPDPYYQKIKKWLKQ
jgi:hypothetical protein